MKCPLCKTGMMHQKIIPQLHNYKGNNITLMQSGMWCDKCDEGILSAHDIEKTDKEFQKFQAKIDNILTPAEIRMVRKNILGLTQKEAGVIFGGGKNAFSRYERGAIVPMLAVSNLLKLLKRHPEDLNLL
jgi:HTH-type transcriptional regulator/antitoxin MqsA